MGEKSDVQKSDKGNFDRKCKDRRGQSHRHPVHDKYENRDVKATTEQILRLEAAGCDIIRCAVPTMEAAEALREIKKNIHIPLVADIHFDYRLAIAAIENGADKIRTIREISAHGKKCRLWWIRQKSTAYRSVWGKQRSLEKHLLEKYGG